MIHYDYSENYLRQGYNPSVYTYVPIKNNFLQIDVLVGEQKLSNLVKLIPMVEILVLRFCDSHVEYDVSPLVELKYLNKLTIKSVWCKNSSRPRLRRIKSLISLNLYKLKIYKKELDPTDPIYSWPPIRKPEFIHIKSISDFDYIINYELYNSEDYPEKIYFDSYNFIVQSINNCQYQIIFRQVEHHHYDDLFIRQLTKEQFLKFILKKDDISDNNIIPKNMDDLFLQDAD